MPSKTRNYRRNEMEFNQMMPLNRRAVSHDSLGRYSERSLHSNYRVAEYSDGGTCNSLVTRIPYATVIATVMCLIGIGIFCGTIYRGTAISVLMFDQVFHLHVTWMEAVQMTFVVLGACVGALGILILFANCLATGATRRSVYRGWRARVGGRISCLVFMVITYILQFGWLIMWGCLVIITIVYLTFWGLCSNEYVQIGGRCIDFTQFDFLFPSNTLPEQMKICDQHEVKMFCKDYVEKAVVMFILATVACLLVILSMVQYLMCLSSNYAHIRDHEKLQELQDMQYLHETNASMTGSKDRF